MTQPLTLAGYVLLPAHTGSGGFDHAAVHAKTGHVYVAHTANSAVDVFDPAAKKHLFSVPDLSAVAGALVSDESQGWYARVVRLVVFPQDWRPDPDGYFETYLKPAVEHATERRLYAIVDWHEIGDAGPADVETRQFWAQAAPAFASYPNVLYEVFNEAEDLTDTSWSLWKSRAQPWVDQIRRAAPANVILIGAPFWTQALQGAVSEPFTGDNLAYVGHIYPGIERSVWGLGGAFTQVAAVRPLMITEWGYRASEGSPVTGDQSSFGDALKAYIEEQRLGWTAWCADTVWSSQMFDPSWNLLVGPAEMGGFTKDWLAEKKDADQPAN